MRPQYIFHGEENEPHPFHVKSDWEPPVQLSVALETFLEEVKLELASIEFDKPKDKYIYGRAPSSQRVSRNKSIILKKSDKGKNHRIHDRVVTWYMGSGLKA